MMTKRIFLVLLACLTFVLTQAQKTDYLLQRADKAFADLQFEAAVKSYEAFYQTNNDRPSIIEKIADCYWNLRNYNAAIKWYSKLDASVISGSDVIKRRIAELKAINEEYSEAYNILNGLSGFQSRASGFKDTNRLKRDSLDWQVGYLSINTQQYREFSPLVLDKKFVWSSNEPYSYGIKGIMGWDANGYVRQRYLSSIDYLQEVLVPKAKQDTSSNSTTKYAKHFSGADVSKRDAALLPNELVSLKKYRIYHPLMLEGFSTTQYNVGHTTASSHTKKLYTSVNLQNENKDSVVRKIGIVEAEYSSDGVANIHFLNLGTADENVMHPAIDQKGEQLVFSSNKAGGKGGYDLYITKKAADGSWSTPTSLDKINTAGNEVFASFAPNGDLFYSTDGSVGLGGLDIYNVKLKDGNIIGSPTHLSYPLNTQYDEFGIYVGDNGESGYFTSDRYGSDDIFSFNYKKVFTPITGFVIDRSSNLRVQDVPVELYLNDDGVRTKVDSVLTDKNGNYSFVNARPNRMYDVVAYEPKQIKSGLFEIATITTPAVISTAQAPVLYTGRSAATAPKAPVSEPILAKAPTVNTEKEALPNANVLTPSASVKSSMVLDSVYFIIYFDFDKYALTNTSITTLNKAVSFLKQNPAYGFILLGHTDLKGNIDYNIKLSKNRVYTANNYMVTKGVDPKRLKLEYYGKSHPAKSGMTDEDGKLNRRVEFILIKK